MNYFKFFVHVLFMGNGLLIGKKAIYVQSTKNHSLQATILNVFIHLIISSTTNNASNNQKKLKKTRKNEKLNNTNYQYIYYAQLFALRWFKILIPYSIGSKVFTILEIAMPYLILLIMHLSFRVGISSINFLLN